MKLIKKFIIYINANTDNLIEIKFIVFELIYTHSSKGTLY